jgi:peptidoglycan/LPS O-acetylase OafA/YrhL
MLSALGAGLLIQFGRAPLSSLLLNNRVARGIGLISYSAYLAHWPLLVFFRGQHVGHLQEWLKWMLTPTALLIAWGMYAAVEKPFRRPRAPGKNTAFLVSLGLLMSAAVGGGLTLHINDGWPQRPAFENRPYAQVDILAEKRKRVERNQ